MKYEIEFYQETQREWSPNTVLALLEKAYMYYEDLFQTPLPYKVTVQELTDDRLYARNSLSDDNYMIKVSIPHNFGFNIDVRALVFHFYVHELLHCWTAGTFMSHAVAEEALVKFQSDLFLMNNEYISKEYFQILNVYGINDSEAIRQYKQLYYNLYMKTPDTYIAFLKDVANAKSNRETLMIDIFPILKRYFGEAISQIDSKQPSQPQLSDKDGVINKRPKLGIGLSPLMQIDSIFKGLPAEKAGLQKGDIILKINDMEVKDPQMFIHLLNAIDYGERLTLVVKRQSQIEDHLFTCVGIPITRSCVNSAA